MQIIQFIKNFMKAKNICFKHCNYLNGLSNTKYKKHFIIQNMYICGLHLNKKLLQYHTSRYYGIKQNWSVLLRIGLQKFCKTIFDNIYFKYLYFLNNFLKLFISIIILLILIVSIITFKFKLSLNNAIK